MINIKLVNKIVFPLLNNLANGSRIAKTENNNSIIYTFIGIMNKSDDFLELAIELRFNTENNKDLNQISYDIDVWTTNGERLFSKEITANSDKFETCISTEIELTIDFMDRIKSEFIESTSQ